MNDIYDEYSDLLGAYALDAVEVDERDRIELHLLDCPRCRAEVAEHREVAALLSQSGAQAPEGVWDRILSELSPPAPPLRMTFARDDEPSSATVVDDADRGTVVAFERPASPRRRIRTRTMVAVVAVAASIVAILGVVAVGQTRRLDRVETALNERSIDQLATEAMLHSDMKVRLEGKAGSAEAVVTDSGQGYLMMDEVPPPADGEVYQLWGKVDGTILSLGTFGDASVVPFSVDPDRLGDIELFAVTKEQAPGVVSSTNKPMMAGTV